MDIPPTWPQSFSGLSGLLVGWSYFLSQAICSLSFCILYNFNSTWCCHSCFHWHKGGIPTLHFYFNWIIFLGERRGTQVNSSHTVSLKPCKPWKECYVPPPTSPTARFLGGLCPDFDPPSPRHAGPCTILLALPPPGRTIAPSRKHRVSVGYSWRWRFLRLATSWALALALLEWIQPSLQWLHITGKCIGRGLSWSVRLAPLPSSSRRLWGHNWLRLPPSPPEAKSSHLEIETLKKRFFIFLS